MKPMDAVIYIRVSSDEQVAGTSLATQEADCRAYCQRQGLNPVRLFADRGESAKTSDRPQFLALVDYVAKYRPGEVVVWKFDRWARNSQDHAIYSAAIAKHGARLVSATEPTEDNPAGRMLETILSAVAQFDNEVRADRSTRAMRSIAMRGGWCSLPPFGYRTARASGLPILEPDLDRAPVVADLFAGIEMRRRSVAQTIAAAGEHRIAPNACRKMLRNGVYAGFIRNRLTDGREVSTAFPGIVRRPTFDAVQVILDGGGHAYPVRMAIRADFPLRGILHCAECGAALTAANARGRSRHYPYYACRAGHVRQAADLVHESLVDLLRADAAELSESIGLIRVRLRHTLRPLMEIASKAAGRAGREVDRVVEQRARLLDLYLAGGIAQDVFSGRDADLARKLDAARAANISTDAWIGNVDDAVGAAARLIDDPVGLWSRLAVADRRRFIAGLYGPELTLDAAGVVKPRDRAGLTGAIRGLTDPEVAMAPPGVAWLNLIEAVRTLADLAA